MSGSLSSASFAPKVDFATGSIPTSQRDAASGSFSVPVNFTSDGASIASVGFALDYQESCLTFDATDGNSDNIPDAITGLPSGFAASISHDANDTAGELDISFFDNTAPCHLERRRIADPGLHGQAGLYRHRWQQSYRHPHLCGNPGALL